MSTDFLTTIIEHKRRQIAQAQQVVSLNELKAVTAERTYDGAFAKALRPDGANGDVRIIAEIKRASPSKGDICLDLDPASMARQYAAGGAAAISVLTEPDFFKGTLDDLRQVKQSVSLPVLRKDFIIDAYQLYEAAAAGADAVLLIVRCLTTSQLSEFIALARELGMDALVEVHAAGEVAATIDAHAELVGINNRDLQTFDTDAYHAAGIATLLAPGQVPIVASDISTPDDIVHYRRQGLCAFLVGESIVRSSDPTGFIRQLRDAQ